jgi:diadenosine tetraphosphate (Ap4A) HIT family hydrolase
MMNCELCVSSAETLLWKGPHCRVILAKEDDYPGFCRVIWNDHIKEMSDLKPALRAEFMDIVFAVEAAVRDVMQPEKINLASLGNMVPHLHWHVIPRYLDDTHFPAPIWSTARRSARVPTIHDIQVRLTASILKHINH